MRLLIVLSTFATLATAGIYEDREYYQYRGPPAPLNNDGMVMDTPEVAHARAAHLAMHAETLDKLRKAQNEYDMYENNEMMMMGEPMMPKRQRQRMFAPSTRDGRMMGNSEMADPKNYLTSRSRAASKASEFYEFDLFDGQKNLLYLSPVRVTYKHAPPPMGYRGPLAPLGSDGRVVDTPEVMRAREAHMKAHARAVALSTHNDLYY